jgi:hypothetical protein
MENPKSGMLHGIPDVFLQTRGYTAGMGRMLRSIARFSPAETDKFL